MKHRSEAILIAGFSLLVGWMGAMTGCSTTQTASSGAQHASSLGPRTQTITMPLVVLPAVPLKYNGPATYASNPGGMRLSAKKLEAFRDDGLRTAPTKQIPFPELRMDSIPDILIDKYLQAGDCNAAVVISIAPRILVAAYSEELDCVVLLGFDPKLLEGCHLKVGDRLVASDMYGRGESQADDVIFGPGYFHRWRNFYPLIAEFLSDDGAEIAQAKSRIPETQWERTWQLVEEYMARFGRVARNGNPYFSSVSAEVPSTVARPSGPRLKYHDPTSVASNPGGIGLSAHKLAAFKDDLLKLTPTKQIPYPEFRMLKLPDAMIDEHLRAGDSRAALVISTAPRVLVAAYTDELDCVVLLSFDPEQLAGYHLKVGDRLLSVNTYEWKPLAPDIIMGPNNLHRYQNVYPLIAEFLSDDLDGIARTRSRITAAEWARTQKLAEEYMARYGQVARDGNPYLSSLAAKVP